MLSSSSLPAWISAEPPGLLSSSPAPQEPRRGRCHTLASGTPPPRPQPLPTPPRPPRPSLPGSQLAGSAFICIFLALLPPAANQGVGRGGGGGCWAGLGLRFCNAAAAGSERAGAAAGAPRTAAPAPAQALGSTLADRLRPRLG